MACSPFTSCITTSRQPGASVETTAAPAATGSGDEWALLSCIRQRESRGIYTAVNAAGYYGAYQFHPATWDNVARHAGRPDLVGVRPDRAAPADQDAMALALLRWQGAGPWGGGC